MRLFRRRPILDDALFDMLEESGRNVEPAAKLLHDLLEGFPEESGQLRELTACEQEGDRLVHDLITRLNQRHFRDYANSSSLHELARRLDDVVDYAEECADQLVLYRIEAPMEQAERMSEVLVQAAAAVGRAIGDLRANRPPAENLHAIHELENEGDRLSREAMASLFAKGIDPLVIIRWKDVYESLEQAIDACEGVSHLLESVHLNGRR